MDEMQTLWSARAAIEKGDQETARKLLLQVIQANPRHETAWLWLSALVGDPKRERECLQRVLMINPQNAVARRHLDRLDQQAAPVVPQAAAVGGTTAWLNPSKADPAHPDQGDDELPNDDTPWLVRRAEPGPYLPVTSGESSPSAAAPKRKRASRVVIALAAVAAVLCLCLGGCLAVGGWGVVTGMIQTVQAYDDVVAVLDRFMRDMEQKDASTAFELFSSRAQRQMDLSDLEALIRGSNYAIFEGYESLAMRNLSVKAAFNTNPDLPQGTIAEVSAAVTYQGGFAGTLTAVLEKENDVWRLHRFNIVVPPDKIAAP